MYVWKFQIYLITSQTIAAEKLSFSLCKWPRPLKSLFVSFLHEFLPMVSRFGSEIACSRDRNITDSQLSGDCTDQAVALWKLTGSQWVLLEGVRSQVGGCKEVKTVNETTWITPPLVPWNGRTCSESSFSE